MKRERYSKKPQSDKTVLVVVACVVVCGLAVAGLRLKREPIKITAQATPMIQAPVAPITPTATPKPAPPPIAVVATPAAPAVNTQDAKRNAMLDELLKQKAEKLRDEGYDQIGLGNFKAGIKLFKESNDILANSAPQLLPDQDAVPVEDRKLSMNGRIMTPIQMYLGTQKVNYARAQNARNGN